MSVLPIEPEAHTYQLVLAQLTEVNDRDGTFRGINLGSIEGDELFHRISLSVPLHPTSPERTLSMLMVGRK